MAHLQYYEREPFRFTSRGSIPILAKQTYNVAVSLYRWFEIVASMGRRGVIGLRESGQAEFESVQPRFDVDIYIAQAKRSAINLCNETLLHLPEIILCLPVFRWKVTRPG